MSWTLADLLSDPWPSMLPADRALLIQREIDDLADASALLSDVELEISCLKDGNGDDDLETAIDAAIGILAEVKPRGRVAAVAKALTTLRAVR